MIFRRRKQKPQPRDLGPLEGEQARERAEAALAEVRERKERQQILLRWLRTQYEVNGYGRDVDAIWGGRR